MVINTVLDVEGALEEIRRHIAGLRDDESAHRVEKDLWEAVLVRIAKDPGDAQELASAALKSTEIEFSRWFA